MTDVATVTALRPDPTHVHGIDTLASRETFEHMQRVAKVFCASDLIPAHLKKNNGADALLALAIAKRMGEDPVSVCQNIYFVSGKAGWSASYMIARANRSGVFKGPIRWRSEGEGDGLAVTARGRLAEIEGEDVEVTVSMKMAKAEGWVKNPKYNTMAEHMLRWRSATMLIRLYCPEVMMGMPTDDELTDQRYSAGFRDITTEGHATTASQVGAILGAPDTREAAKMTEANGEIVTTDGEIISAETAANQQHADTSKGFKIPEEIVGLDARLDWLLSVLGNAPDGAAVDRLKAENAEFFPKLGRRQAEIERKFEERKIELSKL